MLDEMYMRRALDLAGRARGRTCPNPMVGAVVVRRGRVVSEGYHRKAGGPHAEVIALRKAGPKARGATLYVTLEPCSHLDKRTPPCSESMIRHGIKRVVIAMKDPNPKVNGKGMEALRRAGIKVVNGMLRQKAHRLNEVYIKYVTTGLPFVIWKSAMSLDGKISSRPGSVSRISGKRAIREAHRLRNQVDAILVGINTILIDNPRLTTRLPHAGGKDPQRVILDSRLRIPLRARVLTQKSDAGTIIATTRHCPRNRIRALEKLGATVWVLKDRNGRVSFPDLLSRLGRMGITSLLIEGGGEVNASALSSGIVDKLVWFIAPRIIGRPDAVGILPQRNLEPGWSGPRDPAWVHDLSIRMIGEDIMLQGYL